MNLFTSAAFLFKIIQLCNLLIIKMTESVCIKSDGEFSSFIQQTCNMMNRLVVGTLTFLIFAPAISICDEDLDKGNSPESLGWLSKANNEESAKSPQSFYNDDEADPWSFYRQLRAPSGFLGVRGKKDVEPDSNEV